MPVSENASNITSDNLATISGIPVQRVESLQVTADGPMNYFLKSTDNICFDPLVYRNGLLLTVGIDFQLLNGGKSIGTFSGRKDDRITVVYWTSTYLSAR